MPIPVPTTCMNPECREPSVKVIHCSSQKVAIDAVDGPPVYSHFITYRCSGCGHTWATRRFSPEDNLWSALDQGLAARGAQQEAQAGNRGLWERIRART